MMSVFDSRFQPIEVTSGFDFGGSFKVHEDDDDEDMLAPFFDPKDTDQDMMIDDEIEMWNEKAAFTGSQNAFALPDQGMITVESCGFQFQDTKTTSAPQWNGRQSTPTNSNQCIKNRTCTSPWNAINNNNNSDSNHRYEPSQEPYTDEIPWSDLVYWLGNSVTGQLECTCHTCVCERSNVVFGSHHAYGGRLSAKIPVISMPRIEGVN